MHIGFVTRFKPANLKACLNAADQPGTDRLKGRNNTVLINLIPSLLARGHRISVFAAEPETAESLRFSGDRLTVRVVPCRVMAAQPALRGYRRERAALVQVIREEKPDLLHAHWLHDGHAAAALDSGLPTLIMEHGALLTSLRDNGLLGPRHILDSLARMHMTWTVCRRSRHMSAVSPYTAEHLRRYFRYTRPIHIIPTPFPFETWRSWKTETRRPYDPARPVFADIARWGRLKNTTTLLQSFARVRRVIPGARLILFGGGLGSAGPAGRWAKRQGLEGGVTFQSPLPYEDLMRKLAGDCDCLVHLSRIETFCNVVCEALAFDVPVIAGRVGGIPWAVDPVPVTFLRDVTDPEEAATAMIRQARDPAMGQPRGWAAQLERRYAPERIAELVEGIYTQVLARP